MEAAELRPVPDRPALELRPAGLGRATLVVADLHLGLGATGEPGGLPPAELARAMAFDLLATAREREARGIIVAGDAKHPIVGTPPPLRRVVFDFFSTLLAADLDVELVLGNHDVGIVRHLPREVVVHPARGIVRDGVGIFHGHRWPSNPVLRARRLVVGHLHPGFRFAPTPDAPSARQRCWVRVAFPPRPPPTRRRRRRAAIRAEEMIVLPAFNPIAGAESLNRTRPARGRSFLFRRFLATGRPRAYLLDGTDVGPIVGASPGPRSRGARRSAPDP